MHQIGVLAIRSGYILPVLMKNHLITTAFTTLLFYGAHPVHAQNELTQDLTNSGILTVSSGTTLTILGSFQNNATAQFTNDGDLYLRRHLVNQQSGMQKGLGTLWLNGTDLQLVSGSAPFRTQHLNSNNSSGIQLNHRLEIFGLHTFQSGLITATASDAPLSYDSLAAYTGATDNSHVNGWVNKNGSSDFIFPVGSDSYLRPVTLKNLSGHSSFLVKYEQPTFNHTQVAPPLMSVNANEYWQVNRLQGGTATVVMNWDATKVPMPFYNIAEIRGSRFQNDLWTSIGGTATGDVTQQGTVTVPGVNAFGAMVIGSIGTLVGLNFMQFTAVRRAGVTWLNWQTRLESDLAVHEVERSDDALHFRKIGSRPASNASGITDYEFQDLLPLNGTAWYRIRTLDLDGTPSFSKVVSVRSGNTAAPTIINNPAAGTIYIAAGATGSGNYQYQIFSSTGQVVQQGQLVLTPNGVTPIRLQQLFTQGIYILDIRNALHRVTQQVLIR